MKETMASSHWSLTLDHRFQPIRAAKLSNHTNVVANPMYRIPDSSSSSCYGGSDTTPRNTRLTTSSTPASSNAKSSWQRGKDSEVKRKQRIASYKAYAVEGKIKASVRKTFRWMKNKYSYFVHGY
ncbi:unnamed protein product [Coffea canephora]|uniref:DUF3511 domain-containing protein n=1 Tax=Coffea canephora TaxID=49390 RepID=A0A068TRY7_COFCA|nr:unnamed protein product [Coffea canephora]